MRLFTIVGVVGFAVLALACGGQPNFGNRAGTGKVGGKSGTGLSVVETHQDTGAFGSNVIAGTVRNSSANHYRYVHVEINLYDEGGRQIGSTLANTNNLEAGGEWRFEAPILDERAKKFRVMNVSGF